MFKYPKSDIVTFGRQLFLSGDLDPVYLALLGADYPRVQLARWLVAYWLFYSAGFACYASAFEGDAFWSLLSIAASNSTPAPIGGRWPRGAERRHFRGRAASVALRALRERYGSKPEDMLDYIASGSMLVGEVIKRATEHVGFGPWIGFKIADMIDAVWCRDGVLQDDLSLFLYDTPREAIERCYQDDILGTLPHPNIDRFEYAMSWLRMQLRDCRIPHKPKLAPDWFSLETVWCKYLSHQHGFYPLGKDTVEITHGLAPWSAYASAVGQFSKKLPVWQERYRLW